MGSRCPGVGASDFGEWWLIDEWAQTQRSPHPFKQPEVRLRIQITTAYSLQTREKLWSTNICVECLDSCNKQAARRNTHASSQSSTFVVCHITCASSANAAWILPVGYLAISVGPVYLWIHLTPTYSPAFDLKLPKEPVLSVRTASFAMDGGASPDGGRGEGKGKGKGKALDDHQNEPNGAESQRGGGKSTFARIAQSATSLPAALFSSGVGVDEVPQLGADGKGGSSRHRGAPSRVGESSAPALVSSPANLAGVAMKSGQTQEHVAKEEAAFAAFLDSTDAQVLVPVESEKAWQPSTPLARLQTGREEPPASVVEQEQRDGADVVALLSAEVEPEPDYGFEELSSRSDLSRLRTALFGEGETSSASSSLAWDNVLNFIPHYFHEPVALELSTHLGTADRDEAWQAWIGQWSRVLTDYNDEVWGDLEPLLNQARAEVQSLKDVEASEKPPQPTALLRLRAILGHLRGEDSP
ncbi:hypothetical protein B0T16DRAFT_384806 [Cercophora newfieldiana]|uniref:Uncharacterized protein n=1 Tax=Cercophora newfieldiana TaxID=92897 RepID=A0AA39YQH4_9PEZI|nr:hypothetical protein B0T16DRAFT_384806 [Cercophora newfieldiana]